MNRGASWDTIRSSSGTGLKLIMLNYINICYNPVKVRQQSTIVLLSVEYVPLIQHLGWVIKNKNHTNLGLCCLFLWLSCQLLWKDRKAPYSPAEWSVHRVCNPASQVSFTTSWICFSTGVNSNSLPHLWKANCLAYDSTNNFDFWFSLIKAIRAL